MSKTFTYKISSDPKTLIQTAKQKAEENGIIFEGDAVSGKVKGKGFAGEYTVSGNILSLKFSKKPFIISWSRIEKKLAEEVKKW